MALNFSLNRTSSGDFKTFQIVKILILRIILRKIQNSKKNSKNKNSKNKNVSEYGPWAKYAFKVTLVNKFKVLQYMKMPAGLSDYICTAPFLSPFRKSLKSHYYNVCGLFNGTSSINVGCNIYYCHC